MRTSQSDLSELLAVYGEMSDQEMAERVLARLAELGALSGARVA